MRDKLHIELAKLKEKYDNKRVSVMVGAGFSKNACDDYPSWNELLYDMTIELYQDDIDAAYLRYLSLNSHIKISFDVFAKQESNRIIARVGALNIVSEYIARKGFRESIENYIEERIPYIDNSKNLFKYGGKNGSKSKAVVPDNFAAHKKLVKMRGWNRIYTTNYDQLLEYAAEIDGTEYQTITTAKELSIFNDKVTIIKLHGDLFNPLRSKNTRAFRFDGNPHQQYIISAEDYASYPKDHEAFTQLMRIYLLQGVFCLIGFSGDDPNFINWIEWVRDILERDGKCNKEEDYKIYLVGVSDKMPSPDKQIFYENHSIFYIPLLNKRVKKAIGVDASNTDVRDLFCHLFEYLEPQEVPQSDKIDEYAPVPVSTLNATTLIKPQEIEKVKESGKAEEERTERKEYLSLWNKVYETSFDKVGFTKSLKIDEATLERLWEIKIWNRFVNYSYRQNNYLDDIWCKQNLTTAESELAILAFKDTGVPIDGKIAEVISKSGIEDVLRIELGKLNNRAETLYMAGEDDNSGQIDSYDCILRKLFNLDFGAAKNAIKDWSPKGSDILKKALLLSFLGEDGAVDLLLDYIKTEPNTKEQFYATRLLNLVENTIPSRHSLSKFENTNVQDYFEVLSNYLKRVKPDKEKIGRYGDAKNEKVIHMDGKPDKIREAVAVLNFLIEAPALLSHKNFYNIVKAEDWYPVHKELFELFPYATLFYSIQCLDKKVRTRIGQDYAYSDALVSNGLDNILCNLLRAIISNDTPAYLKEAMMSISKEIFVSVPSSLWEDLFLLIWNNNVERRLEAEEKRLFDALDSFIYKGLNSITNKSVRQKLISDILNNAKKDTGFAINCLYYLNVVATDGSGNEGLSNVIDEFISHIDLPEEITIAGNISKLLTNKQRNEVAEKCVEVLRNTLGKEINSVVFHSAQFFVKNDVAKRQAFVEAICASPLLWRSGVTEEGHFVSSTFLSLSNFMRRIYIGQVSLTIIYDKLKESLGIVVAFVEKHKTMPFLGDIDGLLAEMESFLNYHKKRLKSQSDYKAVCVSVKSTLQKIRGVKNIEDGLLSIYEGEVVDSLSFILSNRETLSHKDVVRYVGIIVNRVMFRNSDGLDTCIGYLRLFLEEGLVGKDDETIMTGYVDVLDRFTKETAQECNMELVMTTMYLAKIAKVLTKYGYSSEGIKYWTNFQKSGRFVTNFK
ncbi:MAG: SIR2 family protein [Bacteroidales bacterium]|nr:SIR2 family protein [Bacteroidales bacterium]